MSVAERIGDKLREITKRNDEIFSIRAIVVDVDTDTYTCDCAPFIDGGDLLNVQIIPRDAAGEVKKGIIVVPKIGSVVFVTMLNNSDGFVSMTSEVETVLLGGDDYGGLTKIEDLVEKMNNVENKVNDILTILKAIAIPLAPSGTYLFSSIPALANAQPLTPTQKEDLENELIKHGPGV